jgi:hypothetical protein
MAPASWTEAVVVAPAGGSIDVAAFEDAGPIYVAAAAEVGGQ